MIRFNCTYCGRGVRVANICAGRQGRCPECNRVVQIPVTSTDGDDQLSTLAHVVQGDPRMDSTLHPPPPPPVGKEDASVLDDLPSTGQNADPSMDTDILPAEHAALPHDDHEPHPVVACRPSRHAPVPKDDRPSRRLRIFLLALFVVVAAAVLAGTIYLKWRRGR